MNAIVLSCLSDCQAVIITAKIQRTILLLREEFTLKILNSRVPNYFLYLFQPKLNVGYFVRLSFQISQELVFLVFFSEWLGSADRLKKLSLRRRLTRTFIDFFRHSSLNRNQLDFVSNFAPNSN